MQLSFMANPACTDNNLLSSVKQLIEFDDKFHSSKTVTSATKSLTILAVDSFDSSQATQEFNGFSNNFNPESFISGEPEMDPTIKVKQWTPATSIVGDSIGF